MTPQALREPPAPVAESAANREPICFIVQNMGFGGMEVHTLGLMQVLIARGHDIELISNRYDRYDRLVADKGWTDRVRITHTDLPGILYGEGSDRRGWREVLRHVRSRILIFPKGNNNYGQPGFLRECRARFTKIIFIEHLEALARPKISGSRFGIPGIGFWWHKRRWISRFGSRYADAIVAVSTQVKDRLVETVGFAPEKISVVSNGVPWREFVRDEARGAAVRARHHIPADTVVFGMLTRLTPAKGIDIAVRAVRALLETQPARTFVLAIAGEGPDEQDLKTLAASLQVEERVKFLGFVTDPGEMLSAFDVILFSSRVEGLPLGLLQGMAAGCIPVVTRISGMPQVVNGPDVGWVVQPEDPAAVAEALRQVLLLDTDALTRMRRAATARVRDAFDLERANLHILEVCGLLTGQERP